MKKLFNLSFIIFLAFNLFGQQQINKTLFFDGQSRSYIIYVPASYNGSVDYPLLFSFHGGGGTSSGFIFVNDMRPIADTANFIAVYPQAAVDPTDGSNSWLHKTPTTHNDVNFIEAIIDTLSNDYNIDNDRVYACGYSEGGIFSYELGCRLNDRIAAFSSVSGSMLVDAFRVSYYNLGNCSPIHPTAVLLIPGTIDSSPHSSYSGFQPYYMSVNDITTFWANHNNTDINPTVTTVPNSNTSDGSTIEKRIWENGDNCVAIQELKVINGGHDWPGSSGNMDINASQEIWKFVSMYDINGLINCGSTDITISSDIDFEIFPNPTSEFITINSLDKKYLSYSIFSIVGKMVMNGNIDKSNPKINISQLEPQLYILMIGGNSFKIIKE
ncbi:T9SS type A sorting domain-containing protein [Flavobacteriales bacterium]|nr:T9SS type A sorting domain-containing protein [Flavobacteriales bacterium]